MITPTQPNQKAYKAAVEQWVAVNRLQPTSYELTNLHNTSVLCYRASHFWADNVVMPKYAVHFNGEPVEDDDPRELPKLIRHPSFKRSLWHKNVTESFWGRDLVYIPLNFFTEPMPLHWVNPNMYGLFYSMEGLRPFWVYESSRFEPLPASGTPTDDRRIPLEQAVYTTLLDFRNDYDGTAPAEVAFVLASAGVEMAQTWAAMFRNLAIPAALVQPPANITESYDNQDRDNLINRLREIVQGARNFGRTLVSPKRWEWQNLQFPFKDMDFSTISAEIKEAVATAFAVNIEFFTTGQTNYAELEGKIKLWRENTLKPRCENYALEYTEQLAHRYFGEQWSIVADFSKILPENENEKLTTVRGKLDSLIVTVGKAQELMGEEPDPLLEDYYLVEGIPVPKAELPTLWQTRFAQPAPAMLPFSFNGMQIDTPKLGTPTPAPMQMEAAAKDVDGVPLWVGLSLAGCPELVDKQRQVQAYCGDDFTAEWVQPDDYHVTLLYAPRVTAEQAYAFADAVRSMEKPDLTIGVGGLRVFDSDDARGQYALHFRVSENAALMEYQDEIYTVAVDLGIVPSGYSVPDSYKPHITLGYAQTRPRARRFGRDSVQPQAVAVDYDDVELVRVPLIEDEPTLSPSPNTSAANRELTQWREKIKRKGAVKGLDFKCEHIPADVQEYVRTALRDNPSATPMLINAVFVKAKEKLPPDEPEGSLEPPATPEEFEKYWRRYDALQREIGHVWLTDYMQKAWQKLASRLSKDLDGKAIRTILGELHDEVVSGWLGTMDKPGAMLEVMLGGMAAGNEALSGVNPKPGKAVELNVDWELTSEEAYEFVQKYLFNLIRGIDRTTVDKVQVALTEWLKTGGTLDQLTTALEPIFRDKARAELIAQSESTRAYFEGSSERWRQAGVEKSKWRTVQDAMVCPTCRSLNGTIGTLTDGWKSGGVYYKPPAHPGCRCWGVPVLD